jgi:hypothetical protein
MHFRPLAIALLVLILRSGALARGDGTFQMPLAFAISPPAVGVASGDFNRDGRPDLIAVNGTEAVLALLQDPDDPDRFLESTAGSVGNGTYDAVAADLDGDGDDDLVLADPGSAAYSMACGGDGTFAGARPIAQTFSPRRTAAGDWNGDGHLDIVSLDQWQSFSAHLNDGAGSFTFIERHGTENAHDMAVLDYDGDGAPDIMVKTKETGIFPFRGIGGGRFEQKALIANLTVRGPIAAADFDGDGRGDLVTDYGVGISNGDATYRKTVEFERPFSPVLGADLNGDGKADAAVADMERDDIEVYPGLGDGGFGPAAVFALSGPVLFLAAIDLDLDGRADLLTAGPESPLTLIRGKAGTRYLATAAGVEGYAGSKSIAIADVDADGIPDIIAPGVAREVLIFLHPGTYPPGSSRSLPTANAFSFVEAADLDGDGAQDLAGSSLTGGNAIVALLDGSGGLRSETAFSAGTLPAGIAVGRIDGGEIPDLAVPCTGSNGVAVLLGTGGGAFAAARLSPSVRGTRSVAIGDMDLDGNADLVAAGTGGAAVGYGQGGGDFEIAALGDSTSAIAAAIADLDRDGRPDIAVAGLAGLRIWKGLTGRTFEDRGLAIGGRILTALAVADLEGDALPEILAVESGAATVTVVGNGATGLEALRDYPVGIVPSGIRLADVDIDGALDVVAFGSQGTGARIAFGRPAASSFRRGDANVDGRVDLSDAIGILDGLFLGGPSPACTDAADANDDGRIDLSDPIALLGALFLGSGPLPAPGREICGPDPTADGLDCGAGCSA